MAGLVGVDYVRKSRTGRVSLDEKDEQSASFKLAVATNRPTRANCGEPLPRRTFPSSPLITE